MAKKDLTKVISAQRKHLNGVTQKRVVDELLDELTLHALQLQLIIKILYWANSTRIWETTF